MLAIQAVPHCCFSFTPRMPHNVIFIESVINFLKRLTPQKKLKYQMILRTVFFHSGVMVLYNSDVLSNKLLIKENFAL